MILQMSFKDYIKYIYNKGLKLWNIFFSKFWTLSSKEIRKEIKEANYVKAIDAINKKKEDVGKMHFSYYTYRRKRTGR